MRNLRLVLATLVVAATFAFAGGTVSAGERTPADAVAAYIAGVAQQDFKAVLKATSIAKMSTAFDFVAYIDRLRAMTPSAPAPATSPFFMSINEATFAGQIARQVQFLLYGLMTTEGVVEGKTAMMDAADAITFAASVDTARLSGLVLKQVGAPSPSVLNSDINKRNQAATARIWGADEETDRVALLLFEGQDYVLGFTLLRYGDEWTVSSQSSPIANMNVMGVPGRITEDEFAALIK